MDLFCEGKVRKILSHLSVFVLPFVGICFFVVTIENIQLYVN